MRVLSLFDGISCARVALDKLGVNVEKYYASEIDKYAITIAQKNYPDTIQLGDITKITAGMVGEIDLMIGGSPCQDLSIAKKNREGLDGKRSGLFWEYVRLLKEVKPKYFVLENVASMPKEAKQIITETLGVEPILINAALVSAQNRNRLFWTNIPNINQPEDRGIYLKDILEDKVDGKFITGMNFTKRFDYTIHVSPYDKKGQALRASDYKGTHNMIRIGQIGNNKSQSGRVYSVEGKSVALQANGGDMGAKTGLYMIVAPNKKVMEIPENADVVTFKEVRTEIGKQKRREYKKLTGKDSTKRGVDDKKYITQDTGKANTITTGLGVEGMVVSNNCVRKLTPIECERLQCLPDNYTDGISNTQRYKCLGNGFNVDVVKHILSKIKI